MHNTVMPADDSASEALLDVRRSAIIARLCERTWQVFPNVTDRLRDAGFGPGNWPSPQVLHRVAILAKTSIAPLQALSPPFGPLRPSGVRRPKSLFCSPGQVFEPDMPSAESRLARILQAQGFLAGDVVLNGFNYHLTPAGMLFHNALTKVGCTVIPGGPHNTDALVDVLVRASVTGFVGIAAHLKLVIDRFVELGHRPEELMLRTAMAGGEPAASKIRDDLRSRQGIRAFDVYGTAEVGIVAAESADGDGLRVDDEVIVEIVDPISLAPVPPGVAGHVVLTVDDPDYPMLRLGTGDLGHIDRGASGAFDRLFLLGRLGNSARLRGMLLHEVQVRGCLDSHKAIQGLQIQIAKDGTRDEIVAVVYAPGGDFIEASEALSARFHSLCRLRLDRIEAASGPLGPVPVILDKRVS